MHLLNPVVSFSKTRIAPTPSGYLHAGNALSFLLTYALGKQAGAEVLLRIDDLDRERYRPEYVRDIFETLSFLNIEWQGPQNSADFEEAWSQRHRMNLYNVALQKLREENLVFACVCSRSNSDGCVCRQKHLSLDAVGVSWRFITGEVNVTVKTIDGNTVTESLPATLENFIVRRRDGLPAYQLASVVDDSYFKVDCIIRGNDLWPSTLAQHCLAKALGEEEFLSARFYHHPLLTTRDGEKLSKSAGASSVKHWRGSGQSLTAFIEYIASLLPEPLRLNAVEDLLTALQ